MTDIHVEILRHHLKVAQHAGKSLYWLPDDKTARKIMEIRPYGDEPGECAIFSNFQYVALYNTELSDFAVVERLK